MTASSTIMDGRRRWSGPARGCLGALALYAALLVAGRYGLALRGIPDDYAIVPAALVLAVVGCTRLHERIRESALLAVILALTATVLTGAWRTGLSGGFAIGGVIPFSDAAGYFEDAMRLMHGALFSEFSSRRPLFPGVLATVLAIADGHLKLALEILAAIIAVSLVAATVEMARSDGWVAAGGFLLGLFLFARQIVPTSGTETLGFPLGCLGFASLWRAANGGGERYAHLGLFLLTLGLNARAGAFFVLPAIVLWGPRFLCPAPPPWRFALCGTLTVAAGFAANAVILYALGVPSAGFTNHALTFYGLAFGGDWTLALKDHPELTGLPSADQAAMLYRLAFAHIQAHPVSLLASVVAAWGKFLTVAPAFVRAEIPGWGLFTAEASHSGILSAAMVMLRRLPSYDSANFLAMMAIYGAMALLMVVGIIRSCVRPWTAASTLVAAAGCGILASVPLAPPWDGGVRIYAATVPFMAAFPALGLAWLVRQITSRAIADSGARSAVLVPAATALSAITVVGPILVAALAHKPNFAASIQCTSAYDVVATWTGDVTLGFPTTPGHDHPTLAEFKAGLQGLATLYPAAEQVLAGLPTGTALTGAYDEASGKLRYMVGPAPDMLAAATGSPWEVCAEPASANGPSGIWRVVTLQPPRPPAAGFAH